MGFVDDLKQKAKDTAEKTNRLTREMRIKSMMNDYKGAIEKVYAEIGKKVYEKHIREENIDIKAELTEECSKIDAYAKEVEDLRMEMLALKDLRICKNCAAEISISAKFCPKCGSVQEEIKTFTENNVENNVKSTTENNVESSTEIVSMQTAEIVTESATGTNNEESAQVTDVPVEEVTSINETADNSNEATQNLEETSNDNN